MASRSASIFSAESFGCVMPEPRIPLAARGFGPGLLEEHGDALALLTRWRDRDEALPRLDGARVVLLDLVEHLALVQERRAVLRVDLERLVEGLERGVGVAAHRHDQAEMRHGVDVLAVALEHRLVGRDGQNVDAKTHLG